MPVAPAAKPMLCHSGELPADDNGWVAELKWDGARALVCADDRGLCVRARSGEQITGSYPELGELEALLGGRQALLDGELVCLEPDGRPSFARLQTRLGRSRATDTLTRSCPVTFMAFDVLWVDGQDLRSRPWGDRRAALEALGLEGERVQVPQVQYGHAAEFFEVVRARELEGVVLKRAGSRYESGRRSSAWRKVKACDERVYVVCGVEGGKGRRRGRLGCLHLAEPDGGELRYAGSVGSGFSERDLREFAALLAPLACQRSPVAGWRPPPQVICVSPQVQVEVRHLGRTSSGVLRQPVFRGVVR